ncbi:MAG TPA: sialidase family protein [Chitinophagaceae bacterium]|nr:sialidase family protein [Chitinophagaceae bacterium]
MANLTFLIYKDQFVSTFFKNKFKTTITLCAAFFQLAFNAAAQRVPVPVFISGADGYQVFRIPAIIRLPNKDLLAFCEGRLHGGGDFGNIDIVMKRSSDNGKT